MTLAQFSLLGIQHRLCYLQLKAADPQSCILVYKNRLQDIVEIQIKQQFRVTLVLFQQCLEIIYGVLTTFLIQSNVQTI